MVIWTLGNFLAQSVFAAGFVLKLGEQLAKLQLQIVLCAPFVLHFPA